MGADGRNLPTATTGCKLLILGPLSITQGCLRPKMELSFGKTSLCIWLQEGCFIPRVPEEQEQVSENATSHLRFYEQKRGLGILVMFLLLFWERNLGNRWKQH